MQIPAKAFHLGVVILFAVSCGSRKPSPRIESDDLFPVFQGSRYGYIDKTGKIVINPHFVDASSFSEGLARVKLGDRYGYIDKTGKMVINPHFNGAGKFSEGLAKVRLRDHWGYIDKTGKMVINPQFDYAIADFSRGLARVWVTIGSGDGYINEKGEFVWNSQ